jgi:hypothetical protein
MKRVGGRLTYANVVSSLCLFLLLGGGAAYAATHLAKNSVGTKQLKKNAVTSEKVKDGSLGAVDIGGPVDSALKATSADTATSATTAGKAADAENLGGSAPSAYKDRCPQETTPAGKSLCVSGPATKGEVEWVAAAEACAERGLRLPTPGEALMIGPSVSIEDFWTDDFWTNETQSMALFYNAVGKALYPHSSLGAFEVICVTTPTNS